VRKYSRKKEEEEEEVELKQKKVEGWHERLES
jgi:hypothetical protein